MRIHSFSSVSIILSMIMRMMILTTVCRGFTTVRQTGSFRSRYQHLYSTTAAPPPPSRINKKSKGNNKSNHNLNIPTVALKRSRQSKSFRNGNQLVFTRALLPSSEQQQTYQNLQMGDLVQVVVPREGQQGDDALGLGVYNPHSLYKIRFLCHRYVQPGLYRETVDTLMSQEPSSVEQALTVILRHHLQTAWQLRQGILFRNANNNMGERTDTYRLVNGEGDSLSGLAVDVIGPHHAVVMSSALWCQRHQSVILATLQDLLGPEVNLIWKTTPSRLEQDGCAQLLSSRATKPELLAQLQQQEQEQQDNDDSDSNDDKVVVYWENGVQFAARPYGRGQKTGVYCDQRENRRHVASLVAPNQTTVLDLCCYHAGFGLTALVRGGARSVTAVDSSADAVQAAADNAALNGIVDDTKLECVQADIADFLQSQQQDGRRQWDLVVLDPPKLAPSASGLDKARRKYHALNRDALKVVQSSGGYLMTCTCSAAMTQKDGGQYFLDTVQGAALAAGRSVTLVRVSGAASCHTQSPISWPAGAYLTAALFYVHPVIN